MTSYRLAGAKEDDTETIYATHPAPPNTFMIYAQKDGTYLKVAVVLWGVLGGGVTVPLTLGGVWDGIGSGNTCVLHPDGSCSDFERSWETVEEAVEDLKQYATN